MLCVALVQVVDVAFDLCVFEGVAGDFDGGVFADA